MKDLDDFFVAMNPSFSLKGSVKKKLKVGLADEFDLNLTMHLPLDESRMNEIKVEEAEDDLYASWFTCEFPSSAINWPTPRGRRRKGWRSLFERVSSSEDAAGDQVRLRADGLRNWMQGLVHRALSRLRSAGLSDLGDVRESRSGPAITLAFSPARTDVPSISIDVVPSIQLPGKVAQ